MIGSQEFAVLVLATALALPALSQAPAFNDQANMMKQLGIKSLRRGADPNNQSVFNEALANPYKHTMPDVLTMKDGTKVTRPDQWSKRRKEILEEFEREIYGRVPKNVPKIEWEVTGVIPGEFEGIQTVTRTLVGHVDNSSYPSLKVDIQASFTVPANSTKPVPIMIEIGGFMPPRRSGVTTWTDLAISKGWGYGSINPNSIQPDNARLDTGIIGLCNKGGYRKPDDWGALRAWAWGASRMVDLFERNKDFKVDAKKVAVEGVSRYGKAAIVAQAFDARIAVGFIGSSGEGGTKLHRHIFGEALENLAGGMHWWTAGNLMKYASADPEKTVADLPVDSHQLIALCAPRPCFISHGVVEKGDAKWIDARGSWMAGILAGPVYRLLGKSDFGVSGDYLTEPMPAVNQLVGGDLAWRQHDGGHEVTPNWPAFFDWVVKYVAAEPPAKGGSAFRVLSDMPSPRTDPNSLTAHGQLVEKAKKGGIDLYFLGDSITRRWGTSDAAYSEMLANWKENFFGWNAGNFGWGGDTTQNILWRIQNGELDTVNPKVIVLLAGTNNLGAGETPDNVVKGVRAILRVCQQKAPKAKIVLLGVLARDDNPALTSKVDQTNRGLARLANGEGIRFLDINPMLTGPDGKLKEGMAVDGLHLAVKGYQTWADGLKPILTDWLEPRASTDKAPPPTGDPSATKPPSG